MDRYYRITGYVPEKDYSFIIDSNGRFDKLWEFSVYAREHGVKVLEVSDTSRFLDGDILRVVGESDTKVYLRAIQKGRPTDTTYKVRDVTYRAVSVGGYTYIPEMSETR